MLNEAKTAQMAAYLLGKYNGSLRYIKLIKMLYLADRESMARSGDSMTHDLFYSMKNGPVLSGTLNLVKGARRSEDWSQWIKRDGYVASLARNFVPSDLDELSPFDLSVLDKIFKDVGDMEWGALCDWTHEHCAEWRDPGTSRIEIEPEAIFEALGKPEGEARKLGQQYREGIALDQMMARYS